MLHITIVCKTTEDLFDVIPLGHNIRGDKLISISALFVLQKNGEDQIQLYYAI